MTLLKRFEVRILIIAELDSPEASFSRPILQLYIKMDFVTAGT